MNKLRSKLFLCTHSQQTGFLLNYLTLTISNKKMADEVREHKMKKFDRILPLLIFCFALNIVSIMKAEFNQKKQEPASIILSILSLVSILLVGLLRYKFKKAIELCENVILANYFILVLFSCLANTNHMPEMLIKSGDLKAFSFSFDSVYFVLSMLCVSGFYKSVFILQPLYLTSVYFFSVKQKAYKKIVEGYLPLDFLEV